VIANLLVLLGLILEIAGVFFMANGYTRGVRGVLGKARVLASALWRGGLAREATRMLELTTEDARSVLQGIAYIGLGFVFQAAGCVVSLLTDG